MILARIDGNIVTSACHPSMGRFRSVICQPLNDEGQDDGAPILAIDPLGAGLHQRVLISTDGSNTREQVRDKHSPLRNMVLGIIDEPEKKSS